MHILLIGKDGQVGHALSKNRMPFGKLTAIGRTELDLTDRHAIKVTLAQIRPNIIINAAAYTAVDKAETNAEEAYRINRDAVAELACYTKDTDGLLVHYSTDYVFDGNKDTGYIETDPVNPLNIYGKSKWYGEQAIHESKCQHLIFRTSWVYAAHGYNFIKTVFRLAREKSEIRMISDQFGAPTSAMLIADCTLRALTAYQSGQLASGTYHLTAAGKTNWYALASFALKNAIQMGHTFKLIPENIEPIHTEAYPLPAKRPKNSGLDTTKLSTALGVTIPDWSVHVEHVIKELNQLEFFA